jgi:hypothetical protein
VNATGSRSKIVFKRLPRDDPKQRKPDITRAFGKKAVRKLRRRL